MILIKPKNNHTISLIDACLWKNYTSGHDLKQTKKKLRKQPQLIRNKREVPQSVRTYMKNQY